MSYVKTSRLIDEMGRGLPRCLMMRRPTRRPAGRRDKRFESKVFCAYANQQLGAPTVANGQELAQRSTI